MSRCDSCIVRQLNELKAMNKEELKQISNAKVTKIIKKGEAIFEEGEKINGVFCVKKGVSKLSKLSANGKQQIVKLAKKGDLMGQRALVSEEVANLSAVAVDDMEVCFIPQHHFKETLENNHNFTKEVLKHLAQDLKIADNVIVSMSHNTVKQRMAEALLYLKRNFGEDEKGLLQLSLSREDIGNAIGTATESVIRIISELEKEGYIRKSGKKIGIIDASKMQRLVDGF